MIYICFDLNNSRYFIKLILEINAGGVGSISFSDKEKTRGKLLGKMSY